MKGFFVAIEGADICGKSTQVDMLVSKLKNCGVPAIGISFPRYETPVGKAISRHLKGEIWTTSPDYQPMGKVKEDALVFQALQTLDKVEATKDIQYWLSEGSVVVSSRWWQSMMVYGLDLGLDKQPIVNTCLALPQANLNILLNVSEEQALKWRPEARDRYERDREKQKRIREGYLRLWQDHARSYNWTVISGMGSPADVHERILAAFIRTCVERMADG